MLGFTRLIGAKVQLPCAVFNRCKQRLDEWPLRSRPLRDLIDNGLAMLPQEFLRGTCSLAAFRHSKNVAQISVRCEFSDRNFFPRRLMIELADGRLHLVDGDVGLSAPTRRIVSPHLARQTIQIAQLLQRRPSPITLPPVRAGRKPDRKCLGEVFIWMLLRIPSR